MPRHRLPGGQRILALVESYLPGSARKALLEGKSSNAAALLPSTSKEVQLRPAAIPEPGWPPKPRKPRAKKVKDPEKQAAGLRAWKLGLRQDHDRRLREIRIVDEWRQPTGLCEATVVWLNTKAKGVRTRKGGIGRLHAPERW